MKSLILTIILLDYIDRHVRITINNHLDNISYLE